jgi:hypothetical protein
MARMPGQPDSPRNLLLALFFAGATVIPPSLPQKQNPSPVPVPATQPGFTVKVTYSPKAMDTLVSRKETVIVVGYLYGFPKQGTPKRFVDEEG